ncbi:hypothetical protein IMSAGC019_04079 [Lachnospiraceae bacterium]|nr:hypothetical protein IMSAGC019_04079 [Lachnospiraceae bacterium]
MKKLYDEDEDENKGAERAKILVTVIPFVLVIIILAITLISNIGKKGKEDSDNLQQSIMDYADENKESKAPEGEAPVNSSSVVTDKEKEPEKTQQPQETPGSQEGNGQPQPEGESGQGDETQTFTPSPTPSPKPVNKDYSKITYHKEEQLKDMMAYWEDSNQKAIDDLAFLDHYIAMSWSLKGTSDFYYYGDSDSSGKPNGKGVAVYADNQYYYGDWKGGVRSGSGTWIHYHMPSISGSDQLYTYHQYTGNWANDLPDGEGSEHYDFNTPLMEKNKYYIANLIGSYSGAMVHGDFYMTSTTADGQYLEWNAKAEKGAWIYQSENKDKKGNRTVYVDANNPDNYFWMQPKDNQNIRVRCLISKNLP